MVIFYHLCSSLSDIHMYQISFPNFAAALITALLAGALYATLLYFREKKFKEQKFNLTAILALLRGTAVTIIVLLLFSPAIKTTKDDIQKPVLVMAQDISSSIDYKSDDNQRAQFQKAWETVASKLQHTFNVKMLRFGGQVSDNQNDTIPTNSTNIDAALKYIDEFYGDQNLGAVILSSDGIYNEGSNPVYTELSKKIPLYTIAQGDTTRRKDISISEVLYNKIAYLGDKFTIQADLSAYQLGGVSTKLILEEIKGGRARKLGEHVVGVDKKEFFTSKSFTIEANSPGVIRYRVSVSQVAGESNKNNNIKEFFVEVLDGRQKILILAHAPHPDISAWHQTIIQNKNYEVKTAFASEQQLQLGDFDLIILHNLPSEKFPVKDVLLVSKQKTIPLIFVAGLQTSTGLINEAQEIMNIRGISKNLEEVQADINSNFQGFTFSEALNQKIKYFPPLLVPFGEYVTAANGQAVTSQVIKKIKTSYPQLILGEENGTKMAVFCGEGFWKWRLADFAQNGNGALSTEILNKTIQWVTTKEDKRKFRVNTSKNIYREQESVIFEAQLYNDNYELVNDPDVELTVRNEENKEYKYTFSRNQKYYTVNAGKFAPGNYTYTGSVSFGGKVLTSKGSFNIEKMQLELNDMTARHHILAGLSENTGGKMVYPPNMTSLADTILQSRQWKPVLFKQSFTTTVIHLKWVFFLILLLLSTEWFLRRYFGSY